ncbi:glycosyltransferase family 2 protein [Cerasicoccus frondis]|uniref:glycosyltransferase family 2 protein n=1 Tax=Cerasicoccus frondis TaxID=490090 RepID=UPI00285297EB|nr:glycosyltransferase family 2 protein [Cerasicoccus frondis]
MSDNPRISIIIPVYNCLELTRKCIESIEANQTPELPLEIILVDDISTDGAREYVAEFQGRAGYQVILREEKGSFSINNNQAARLARAPILCLLNNDTIVTPGWLEPMVTLLENRPQAGLVGNVQLNPNTGLVDHVGMVCWPDGAVRQARKNRGILPAESWLEWSSVTAACVLIHREVYLSIGGLDEAYRNGCEDADLALRLKEAGYKHYVCNRSVIYHHVSSAPGRANHLSANEQLLCERWADKVAQWSHQEWPMEYFQRYARHWWKLRPDRVLRALMWRVRYGPWRRERGAKVPGRALL